MFASRKYKGRIEKLIQSWSDYRTLVLTRMGVEGVSARDEKRFLDLKGNISEGLAEFAAQYGHAAGHETASHQRGIAELLNRYPTLFADQPLNEHLRHDFEREWHSHFLFFNKLKGLKPEAGDSRTRAQAAIAGQHVPGAVTRHKRSFGSWVGVFVFRFGMLLAIIWVLLNFLPWQKLGKSGPDTRLVGVDAFLQESWLIVKNAATSLKLNQLGDFFAPVVDLYGPELTTVLVAFLLIGLGYWVFVRMR